MVSGPRVDGGTQTLPAPVRKTIQSIKEIVGDHSDADIYSMLKETNMDPNETTQKLLNQDTFHEVKRRRDKKKENIGNKGFLEPRKSIEQPRQVIKVQNLWDRNARSGRYYRNTTRGTGVCREFRVVRDNRVNQSVTEETRPESLPSSTLVKEQDTSSVSIKGSFEILTEQKHTDARNGEQQLPSEDLSANGVFESALVDGDTNTVHRQVLVGEKRAIVPNATVRPQVHKSHGSSASPVALVSTSSVVGLYSKSTDPVHVPSPGSRYPGKVGAIKREVGVVGVQRQSSQNSVAHSVAQNNSSSVSPLDKDGARSTESNLQSSSTLTKSSQFSQLPTTQHVVPGMSSGRSYVGYQHTGRPHQQTVGHQRALQPNMEWKPKSSQKSDLISSGTTAEVADPVSSAVDNSSSTTVESSLPDKLSQVKVSQNQSVIIPQHLLVAESERSGLTFGSFEAGFDSKMDIATSLQTYVNSEESNGGPSVSASNPVASSEAVSGVEEIDLIGDQVRTSASQSPGLCEASELPQAEKKDSSGSRNLDNYGLVGRGTGSYDAIDQQPEHDSAALSSFPGYDSQSGYDVPFFRPSIEDTVRGQGLGSPQETLSSHATSSGSPTTIAMIQQQQQPLAQLYPQVHISHFPNFMPYRQILSPVYVPPMAVPGYSNNPGYPHPSSGNSYLLMPGGSSALTPGNLKYSTSQYKPVPGSGPAGYGSFSNPAGYAITNSGNANGASAIEDGPRIKYKEGNLFVPNPQAETSEIWIQTPRELPGMQTAPYYNLAGQAPHAAYMPSHAGPGSYNAATQTPHVPFPGLYHPSQQAAITNPHHLVHQQLPGMGGNVGVGGPGSQVSAYQQPQLGHLNWTTNF